MCRKCKHYPQGSFVLLSFYEELLVIYRFSNNFACPYLSACLFRCLSVSGSNSFCLIFHIQSFKYFEESFGAFFALQLLILARRSGFSTGVVNMGGAVLFPPPLGGRVWGGGAPQNLMEGGLSLNMRGA